MLLISSTLGGSIPVTLTFANNIKDKQGQQVNVLLLPMGRGDDGAQYVLYFHSKKRV